jgi:hypothetical protein
MKTTRHPEIRMALCVALLAIIAGCAQERAATRPEPSAARTPGPQAVTESADARGILMRMAEFLANTPRFSMNLQDNYDVVQASGQKIEFGERRKVTLSRPNGLRIEADHSNGDKHLVQYDGRDITVFNPYLKVYAQVNKPGGIDEAVMYFLRDLHMRLPLALLLTSRLPSELEKRTQALDYVERTEIHGMPAHHLAGQTETVDYQVWIAEGSQPLPLRVVLTYKNEEGQPQFRAQFSDWNLAPEIDNSQFAFTPPEGAQKIAFAAQLPQPTSQGATPSEQTGGQK